MKMHMPHAVCPLRLRAEDVGLGAFYYFVSVPVINTIAYAGFDRTPEAMALFFTCLAATMALVHLCVTVVPQLSSLFVKYIEPVAAVLATVSVLCAGLSAIDGIGTAFFVICALLTGFTCASATSIWAASPSLGNLRPSAFEIAPPLAWAVFFYIVYRLLQFVSLPVAAGWQVAVPMIGMMALLMAYAPDFMSMDTDIERKRSFLLLGIVAVTYAIASGLFESFKTGSGRAPFNPMVLFEVAGVALICGICFLMRKVARPHRFARLKAAGTLLLVLPTFALGCVTGVLVIPGDESNFLWEASIWVLVLAVFVYGMRTSLFAVRGLAVGVMWEAWCMGQMTARVCMLSQGAGILPFVALGAAVVYFASVVAQIAAAPPSEAPTTEAAADRRETPMPREAVIPSEPLNPLESLGVRFQLSQREREVLQLLAEGRSAKYVSEQLVISFNTARSHIRHIYEKLDVHSKQELIDLIRAGREKEG